MGSADRHRLDTPTLLPRYLAALAAATLTGLLAAAAVATVLQSHRPDLDGTAFTVPALLGAAIAALAALAVAAALLARHADAETLDLMIRHLLWLVFAVALVPSLAWLVLWSSSGSARALLGLAGIAFAGLPLLTAYRWHAALPAVLLACLCGAVALLALWQPLFLLLPVSATLAGGWALALALHARTHHLRA
ncbi:hypothetical protein [Amycolatopsis anabasis]|uniref:hypothetical protein n=1 Tax=Amycolatopsis anabasis TaxID=1840409 RepID=UPI00131DFFE3|nr:hypothetical protein [Amycolatopsis anabasis]